MMTSRTKLNPFLTGVLVGRELNSGGVATLGRDVKKGICSCILIGRRLSVAVVMTPAPSQLQGVGDLSLRVGGVAVVT